MKQREAILKSVLEQMYRLSNSPKLVISDLSKEQLNELRNVYEALGGKRSNIPVGFGPWDIVTEKFIIELDEEQHFNRYRALTLSSQLYTNWPWFDVADYKNQCVQFEAGCLKKASRAGYWTSDSTESQFGTPGPNGVLTGNGSPRWKQRAFYDYCRDLFGKISQTPVYRFSIYDRLMINNMSLSLGDALDKNLQFPVKIFIQSKVQG